MLFSKQPFFCLSRTVFTKAAWPEKMPAKLQYEALEGILITQNFGFFDNLRDL